MDIEKIIDEKLKIMEKVENDLNKHRDEAVLCLSAYIVLSSIWIILIALWQKLGEPIAKSKMTIGVEIIAFIMFLFIIKFISIKIKDFGINKDNLKATLIRAFIICFVVGGLLWTYKYFLMEDKTYDFSQLTTSTGKPVGFLLPSLACNRTSFLDFGIQV